MTRSVIIVGGGPAGLSAGAAAEWLGGIGLLGDMAQLDGFSGP